MKQNLATFLVVIACMLTLSAQTATLEEIRTKAMTGDANAQALLGIAYGEGKGVVKNELIAYQWFLLASVQGQENTRRIVSKLEKSLTAAQRAEGQRLATEWQAAFEKRQAAAE